MTTVDHSFITTPDLADRLARREGGAVSIDMKRERFDALGLGLGLADQREAIINLDGRERLCRLVRVDLDPKSPAVVGTGWIPARA